MKKFVFILLLASLPARALWVKQFGVSDQTYRVFVNSTDAQNITRGFYLTAFPCYSQNSNEYYETQTGKNILTLYCLEPPTEIRLGYITRPRWEFVPKNAVLEGYMMCPVKISGAVPNSVVPKLEVVIQECKKKELTAAGNKAVLRTGASQAGSSVSDVISPNPPAAKPAAVPVAEEPKVPGAVVLEYENQAGTEVVPVVDYVEPMK
ncbi:MAG: hypothetical protein LBL52_03960 [Rickettsiales bacterium]|jgi:hypothetical protein|nr:hypothetical protein [Rickettsiales bacterium]